jgi:hypothetical protein
MDWQIAIAIGAFAVAVFSLLIRAFDRSPTIREHDKLEELMHKEIDRIENRIIRIEDTRPTAGELEARLDREPK